SGFAHLFEHMMFSGSKNVQPAPFQVLESVGASGMNGTTNFDRTNYFEVVPSNQLAAALWVESDRMGYLLDTLDEQKLRTQRDVVSNEKRQSYENPPGRPGCASAICSFPSHTRITNASSGTSPTSRPHRSPTSGSSSGPGTVRRTRRSPS